MPGQGIGMSSGSVLCPFFIPGPLLCSVAVGGTLISLDVGPRPQTPLEIFDATKGGEGRGLI